jgi:hypothetical protein
MTAEPDTDVQYTAAIATASECVAGDFCDVSVAQDEIVGYAENEDGEEYPLYAMGPNVVMAAQEIPVRTDEDDKLGRIEQEAVKVLEANGWRVTGPWGITDNAAYAAAERMD